MKRIVIVFLNMYVGVRRENQHFMFCSNWNDQLQEPIKQCRVLFHQLTLPREKMALNLFEKIHNSIGKMMMCMSVWFNFTNESS